MDNDGYPTDEELELIRKWDFRDLEGWFAFIKSNWVYDGYFEQAGSLYQISTGGWSGHEEIIGAMEENVMCWIATWQQSRRGGHFLFEIPESLT